MAAEFSVISTQSWIYTDETGRVINGFRVFVNLNMFNEVHELNVPNIAPTTVKAKIDVLLKQRKDLATM